MLECIIEMPCEGIERTQSAMRAGIIGRNFERLLDFSFRHLVTPKYAKLIYSIHLLLGLIVATWLVFTGFQTSVPQGLLVLLLSLVGYFLWILYVRVALEFLVAIFRTADNIARASGGGQQ